MYKEDNCSGINEYCKLLPLLNDESYLLLLLANNCGPTIEKVKVSSLFAIKNTKCRKLLDAWNNHKEMILSHIGLSSYTLFEADDINLVLFFDKDIMKEHLNKEDSRRFLNKMGYKQGTYLKELKYRCKSGCPHEIGVFLGYPLDDVIAFIEKPNSQELAVGYWKVYNKREEALKTFLRFDRAKQRSVKRTLQWLVISNFIPLNPLQLCIA